MGEGLAGGGLLREFFGGAAAGAPESILGVRGGGVQSGRDAESDTADERDCEREQQHEWAGLRRRLDRK